MRPLSGSSPRPLNGCCSTAMRCCASPDLRPVPTTTFGLQPNAAFPSTHRSSRSPGHSHILNPLSNQRSAWPLRPTTLVDLGERSVIKVPLSRVDRLSTGLIRCCASWTCRRLTPSRAAASAKGRQTKGIGYAVRRRRARDNASTTQPEPLVGYIVDTRNRTTDKCRYAAFR